MSLILGLKVCIFYDQLLVYYINISVRLFFNGGRNMYCQKPTHMSFLERGKGPVILPCVANYRESISTCICKSCNLLSIQDVPF